MSRACYAFQRGQCNRGNTCKFDHVAGLPPAPRAAGPGPCFAFQQKGECQFGTACKFSHDTGAVGIAIAPAPRVYGAPRGTPGVCFAFQRGDCVRGAACKFSHDLSGAAPAGDYFARASTSKVCYAYQKGTCDRGTACRFEHVDPN